MQGARRDYPVLRDEVRDWKLKFKYLHGPADKEIQAQFIAWTQRVRVRPLPHPFTFLTLHRISLARTASPPPPLARQFPSQSGRSRGGRLVPLMVRRRPLSHSLTDRKSTRLNSSH